MPFICITCHIISESHTHSSWQQNAVYSIRKKTLLERLYVPCGNSLWMMCYPGHQTSQISSYLSTFAMRWTTNKYILQNLCRIVCRRTLNIQVQYSLLRSFQAYLHFMHDRVILLQKDILATYRTVCQGPINRLNSNIFIEAE